ARHSWARARRLEPHPGRQLCGEGAARDGGRRALVRRPSGARRAAPGHRHHAGRARHLARRDGDGLEPRACARSPRAQARREELTMTIEDALRLELTGLVPPLAVASIVRTLPEARFAQTGTLDIVRAYELHQVALQGVRLFTT